MLPVSIRRRIALAGLIGIALLLAGACSLRAWHARIAWKLRCNSAESDAVRRLGHRTVEAGLTEPHAGDGVAELLWMEADYWAWLRDRYLLEPSPLPDRNAFSRRWYLEPVLRRKRNRLFIGPRD